MTITVLLIITIPLVTFIWLAALKILRKYIAERKQTELALRMSQQRFRAIADYTYFWEVWVSPGGNPIWTNPAVERVTGYSANELVNMRNYPICLAYEEDRDKVEKAFKSALQGSTGKEMTFRLRRKDGKIVWVETTWHPIFDDKGTPQGHRASIHDITERKLAEEALLESEERFRDFFENAPIGFHIFGPGQTIIDINEAELEMIGYSREEIVGKKTWSDLIVPQQRDILKKHWHDITTKGHVGNLEYTLVHKDGHHIYVILNASARFDKDGNVVNTRGSLLNITNRKRAEEALQRSEERYRIFVENVDLGIALVDTDHNIIMANSAVGRMLNVDVSEVIGQKCYNKFEKRKQVCSHCPGTKAMKSGQPEEVETEGVHADGSCFAVRVQAFPLFDDKNEPTGFIEVVEDITNRKQAEELIKALSRFPNENPNPVLRISAEGMLLYANQSSSKLLALWQIAEKQCVNTEIYDIVMDSLASKQNKQIDVECEQDIFSLTFAPVAEMNYVNVYGLDITARKRTEQEMERIFNTTNYMICVADMNGYFRRVNDSFEPILGYSSKELLEKPFFEFIHPDDIEKTKAVIEEKLSIGTKVIGFENRYRCKDGSYKWLSWSSRPIIEEGLLYAIAYDITDRKLAEQARDDINKKLEGKNKELESVLYAASHDLRSPLVNIQGFGHELSQSCSLILSALAKKDKTPEMEKAVQVALNEDIPASLDFILASTSKMNSVLSGLLDLCRLGAAVMNMAPIDMAAMMSGIIKSMEYQIKECSVKIDIEYLPPCFGDSSQINRVFSNLLTNALKFIDKSRPSQIRIYGLSRGDKSIYCVEDNGIGIAPEQQEKIFEIFYQLDPEKEDGYGLGLTIAKHIIDRHNGKIWIESDVGKGSRFFVSLPNEPLG